MKPITHRHVHPDSTLAAFVRLRKELDGLADAIQDALPHWITYTEMAKFTEDHYDYILERMHNSMAQSAILPQQKKECMFEKEK